MYSQAPIRVSRKSGILARAPPLDARAAPTREAPICLLSVRASQTIKQGKILFAEGDEAESVYEILEGVLKLYKILPDGRRQIIGFLPRLHIIGFAFERLYSYTAEAVTDAKLHRYSRVQFCRQLDENPEFSRKVIAMSVADLTAAQEQILLLGRKTALEKVASFLMIVANLIHDYDKTREICLPMRRFDIADYLGLSVETVCRILSKLIQDDVLVIRNCIHIRITDRDRLEELASGDPERVHH